MLKRFVLTQCADAIMGVTFFGDSDPQDFGKFDRAFISLYHLTAGDTWVGGEGVLINK